MTAVLVKTGTWFYDGNHQSRVDIFKDKVPLRAGPPEDGPEPPVPTDEDGFYYYAQVTILGGGSGQLNLFVSLEGAIAHASEKLPAPIRWMD